MDWNRARTILLIAFTLVNLVLGYAWLRPDTGLPTVAGPSVRAQEEQVRAKLSDRGLVLPSGVTLPSPPDSMRFLRVEYQSDPFIDTAVPEFSGKGKPISEAASVVDGRPARQVEPTFDEATQATVYTPAAMGEAARDLKLENRSQVRKAADDYLRAQGLLPQTAYPSGIFPQEQVLVVEYVPQYQGIPVFAGYIRAEVSTRGIERVTQFWVRPLGYKGTAPKPVRPAAEAVLRLAGHLERTGQSVRTIVDVRLGYYAGRSLAEVPSDSIRAWDTVPAWRITLDNGAIYYINAFNGELES